MTNSTFEPSQHFHFSGVQVFSLFWMRGSRWPFVLWLSDFKCWYLGFLWMLTWGTEQSVVTDHLGCSFSLLERDKRLLISLRPNNTTSINSSKRVETFQRTETSHWWPGPLHWHAPALSWANFVVCFDARVSPTYSLLFLTTVWVWFDKNYSNHLFWDQTWVGVGVWFQNVAICSSCVQKMNKKRGHSTAPS